MKRFRHVSSLAGSTTINAHGFAGSTWDRGHFLCFSTFQTLDYRISKNIQANPCGFIRNNKKDN